MVTMVSRVPQIVFYCNGISLIIFSIETLDCPAEFVFWVGDGYCDDETNIVDCGYDGGDCCLDSIMTDYCTECQCHETDDQAGSGTTQTLSSVPSSTTTSSSSENGT